MDDIFLRTELLIGKKNTEKLNRSKIAIFGIGGVGSYVVEALARAGIGNFLLVDNDVVESSNINRQIIATKKTIGKNKVEVAKERILDINPKANVNIYKIFFDSQSEEILNTNLDYIIDAIDTVKSKIYLIEIASKLNIPIISSMGTGFRMDPTKFEITDIYNTKVCPLAKIIRKELRKRKIEHLKVLFSKEEPIKLNNDYENNKNIIGSISFIPSVAGLIIAGEVIKDLIKEIWKNRIPYYIKKRIEKI